MRHRLRRGDGSCAAACTSHRRLTPWCGTGIWTPETGHRSCSPLCARSSIPGLDRDPATCGRPRSGGSMRSGRSAAGTWTHLTRAAARRGRASRRALG
jgi:hypothetical protein